MRCPVCESSSGPTESTPIQDPADYDRLMPYTELFGLGPELRSALLALKRNTDVAVVGPRFSGRTLLLDHIRDTLTEDGWGAWSVHGVEALKSAPLAQIEHLLDVPANGRTLWSIGSAARALRDATGARRLVIVIDDVEHLDEASLGVLQAAARHKGAPILTARSAASGRNAQFHSSPTVQIELGPLTLEPFERAIMQHVSGTFELDTVARLHAKSGGLTGLACQIIDVARFSGALEQTQAGSWSLIGALWNSMLKPAVDQYLSTLNTDEYSGMERLSSLDPIELSDAVRVVPGALLDQLNSRGAIRLSAVADGYQVTVFPPLIAEGLRNGIRAVHAQELLENAGGSKPDDVSGPEKAGPKASSASSAPKGWQIDTSSLRERLRTRVLPTKLAWSVDPTVRNALTYLDALLATTVDHAEVMQVFTETDHRRGTPFETSRFVALQAEWEAFVHQDLDRANALLEDAKQHAGRYSRLLDASYVWLATMTRGVPDDFAARLELDDSLPLDIRDSLLETQALVLIALGRLYDARRTINNLSSAHLEHSSSRAYELNGHLLLAEGNFAECLEWAEKGLIAATAAEDPGAIFRIGCLMLLASVFEVDYEKATAIGTRLLSLGEPSPLLPHLSLALRNLGVLTTVRTGRPDTAHRFIKGIERLPFARGPLLGQSAAVANAQMLAYEGDASAAADMLWNEAQTNLSLGFKLTAAQQLLMSSEITLPEERRETARRLMDQIDGSFLSSFHEYLEARAERNPEKLAALVPVLMSTGRPGHAANALELLTELGFQEHGSSVIESARSKLAELVDSRGGVPLDQTRFLTMAITLTDREWDVARLVAEGLTNPEIAEGLVVSVRTVESHLTRIFKKVRGNSREDIRRFVQNQDARLLG